MAAIPPYRIYHFNEQGISFKVTFTLHGARVEKWIRQIQGKILDNAPIKCVGLDVEYTDAVTNVKQRNLSLKQRQRVTVLQLSIGYETLVFQIVHADTEALRDFLEMKTSRSSVLLPPMA
jgi:hypothetical protein